MRRVSERPWTRPPGRRCRPLGTGDVKSRAQALSLDAAIVGWSLSIGAIGSGWCCADRYFRFTCKATHMHRLCGNAELDCEFTNEPLTLHERLQLLTNERR